MSCFIIRAQKDSHSSRKAQNAGKLYGLSMVEHLPGWKDQRPPFSKCYREDIRGEGIGER